MEELKKRYSSQAAWLTSSSNKNLVIYALLGAFLIGLGILSFKFVNYKTSATVEILDNQVETSKAEIVVEISGEVINPGVYKLPENSRVDDLLIISGGLTADANRELIEKYLNRAAKLTDGQKILIPSINQQTLGVSAKEMGVDQSTSTTFLDQNQSLTNINTASLSELDKLPGIGPVYGQSIIDHRPYSSVEELSSRQVLKKNVYDKIKNMVSVY